MAKGRKTLANSSNQKPIEQYNHSDKERLNNPPVGLVSKMMLHYRSDMHRLFENGY